MADQKKPRVSVLDLLLAAIGSSAARPAPAASPTPPPINPDRPWESVAPSAPPAGVMPPGAMPAGAPPAVMPSDNPALDAALADAMEKQRQKEEWVRTHGGWGR